MLNGHSITQVENKMTTQCKKKTYEISNRNSNENLGDYWCSGRVSGPCNKINVALNVFQIGPPFYDCLTQLSQFLYAKFKSFYFLNMQIKKELNYIYIDIYVNLMHWEHLFQIDLHYERSKSASRHNFIFLSFNGHLPQEQVALYLL